MPNPSGETPVSLGSIAERADKLEVAKPEDKKAESTIVDTEPKSTIVDTKVEDKKFSSGKTEEKKAETPTPEATPPNAEKSAPNDPGELRKWNTKVSMELSEIKKAHAESLKQIQQLAELLQKTTKQKVDWKELAKDPAKIQAAVDELQTSVAKEWQSKYDEANFKASSRITRLENQRRFHDENYPRWAELNGHIVEMATKGDSRINFEQDPSDVLDELYQKAIEDVSKDPNYKPPVKETPAAAPGVRTYSEQELQSKIAEAVRKASEEAAKGLKGEENAAGVGSMGQSATKGKPGVDKQALWNMPLSDLKQALQKASDK